MDERIPAFAKHIRNEPLDLFEASDSPQTKAIDRLFEEAVEMWIRDEMDECYNRFKTADKYVHMTDTEFEKFSFSEGT